MASLYEQLGGEEALSAAVDIFYTKVMADDSVKNFFDGVDMKRQARKQRAFLSFAFGGTQTYSGKSMKAVHAKLVAEKGLNDSHFDSIIGHLGATLKDLNVPDELIKEAAAIAETTREDVLGRSDS